jgi:hypothetical protein
VAWVFAIVLDVEIFQVHEIIVKCKNHDTMWGRPGVQPGPAGWFWDAGRFINAKKTSRKAIAYSIYVKAWILGYL